MDSEFGQDSSIDPIISQEAGLNMSELGGNPNHDDSRRESISSNAQLKANINKIMEKAKNNELHSLQEFKNQLDDIRNVDMFTVGIVTVEENKVKITGEDTPNPDEEMNLLQKACYCNLPEFAQELLKKHVDPNKTGQTSQKDGTPPILLAAYHGDLKLIKLLYDSRVT